MSSQFNPYQAPRATEKRRTLAQGLFFKRIVVSLLAFFMAFWAGALAIFFCVVLHEKGLL